jgi:hypothetical protein
MIFCARTTRGRGRPSHGQMERRFQIESTLRLSERPTRSWETFPTPFDHPQFARSIRVNHFHSFLYLISKHNKSLKLSPCYVVWGAVPPSSVKKARF